jgi:hypothetical protein
VLEGEWIDDPDRSDLVLRWTSGDGARQPLTADLARFDLEIHRAEDFVHPVSEHVGAIATECLCGEDLSFEWDEDEIVSPFGDAAGIFTECDACSRTFDPTRHEATMTDPVTGAKAQVRGGAAHRFAVVVRCAAPTGSAPTFHADLVALVEAAFGRDFHEIASISA